ncbi:hypothetical protein OE88DRAFT_1276408 [Heliocybe sulcata]|uniref:Ubiquitin-like domain-containing protein n=1 Tax=Heliocybe sulcata TaxID=5364 RepID=A0A5C3N923_9AGAM|nr:hypothetical protein OE88DRAFT_1276408 [Heliocybe sulcata]
MTGNTYLIRLKHDTPISDAVTQELGFLQDELRLIYKGHVLSDAATPYSAGMSSGDHVDALLRRRVRKPVIYLFSPVERKATVSVSLIPEWSFSIIYPIVPIEEASGKALQQVQWEVLVHKKGSLTETTTGLDVAYLFWEAHTNMDRPLSPPASPSPEVSGNQDTFNPLTADLDSHISVVLPVAHVTLYLEKALLALGLHTEAQTSFITYWLPSFLKHSHVALRFLTQRAYERAAPLDVVPAPDVVTRVFMLFKGIYQEDLAHWSAAQERAREGVEW